MKNHSRFYRNVPLALSAGAYFLLAVPATGTGLAVGIFLTVLCFILGPILPEVWQFTKSQAGKGHWIASGSVCLLMGLRFDNVWKLSGQVSALAARLHMDGIFLLTVTGCILAVCAVYFVTATLTCLLKCPTSFLQDRNSVANPRQPSRFLRNGLIVLLAVQLAVLCYWGIQKQGFHVDEVYTFELSNYPDTIYGDGENAYASWKTGSTFAQILEPADGRLFDLSVPFWNGETDNHPSTYYILVNIFSSALKLLGISVNKWAGLIPNFVCCLTGTVFFVLLLQQLMKNDLLALLGGAVWAFCIGSINMGVYLRMYALLTMAAVIFSWLHLRFLTNYSDGKPTKRALILVQLATIAGVLSQYYFLFYAFFFCGFVCVYFLMKKDWSMLRCYMLTQFSAVAAAELLFTRMLVRLLFGDRGSEALDNMLHGSGYASQLQQVLDVINAELFGGFGAVVMAVSTALLLAAIIMDRHKKGRFCAADGFALLMLATAGGYILAVTKIAPYQVDRYFMCVFPLLILYSVYGVCRGVLTLSRENRVCAALAAVAVLVFTLFCTGSGEISYIYSDNTERAEALEQYMDIPVVALNGDYYNDSVLQWAFEFQNFEDIFLCRNQQIPDIAIAAEDGMLDHGFLLYVHQDTSDDAELFSQISQWIEINHYTKIADTQGCRVFYCTGWQK